MAMSLSKKLPSRKRRSAKAKAIKDEVYQEIEDLIDENPEGQYTHNIIGFKLLGLAEKTDRETANEVVEELSLTQLYNIYPVDE